MNAGLERDLRLAANIRWLVTARWASLSAQAAAVVAGGVLLDRSPAPLVAGSILAAGALTNVAVTWWIAYRSYQPGPLIAGLIALDVLLLTALLALSGGAMNPLSIVYLIYITVASVMLGARATWLTMAACVVCFGTLFLLPWEGELVTPSDMARHVESMRLHVQVMWWSFVFAAILTGYFGSKLSQRLDAQAAATAAAHRESDRHQRLASLATLAAGAAHELRTPLATIAVVVGELERGLRAEARPPALLDDLDLITRELSRCRATLDRLAADAGQTPGEVPVRVSAGKVAQDAIAMLAAGDRSRVVLDGDLDRQVVAPPGALAQALANLLRNGVEADATGRRTVNMTIRGSGSGAAFIVTDQGSGMAPDVLERAGEPFFTTKATGLGMGLGVFLTRALAEQLGGHVRFDSRPGHGTTAIVDLPAHGAGV